MKFAQGILWLLTAIALVDCGRSNPAALSPDAVTRALAAKPHRLGVVFWPEASGCTSCDQRISAVISEWQTAPDAEIAVISVVLERDRPDDPWLPGMVVRLKADEYDRQAGTSPRPRVEIRGADGKVLMSRSVPNYGSQAGLLTEEMLAARSFTAPVAMASRRQP
jgi:hypothetical protein